MTTINEAMTAKGFTPAAQVPATFGRARVVKSITIHHWGLFGQTHDGVCAFFCTTGPGTTSAHYVASAGRIDCIVNPDDAAWHAGNAEGNATSIGIECRPEATDGDYVTVAELVRYLRGIYGDVPLRTHRSWSATACPGIWDLERLDALSRGTVNIQAQSATITPAAPAAQPKEWDEMATKEEIAAVVWGGPSGTMIHNYRLGRGEYPQTIVGAFEGRMQNEILPVALAPLRAELAAQGAVVAGLVGALKAVTAGEAFDEAKLLAGVQASAKAGAEEGVKNAIDSIETTTTVNIKQEDAQ